MSDEINPDDIIVDYTPEDKKKILSLLVDITITTKKIHQRYNEAVNNAFNKFQGLLNAEAKERILKLEKPVEQAFSFGEFLFDAIISMAGAGFLRAFVTFTSIKTTKIWTAKAIIHNAALKDFNGVSAGAVGKNWLGKVQAKIQNDLQIPADELLEITKTSSRHATEVFLLKLAAYKKYVSNTQNSSITLGENLMELANYKSRIANSIADALEDELGVIESFKTIEEPAQFEKVVNYINAISEYQLNVNFDEIFENWSDLVINFILSFYFKQYNLITKDVVEEVVMPYNQEDVWAPVRKINPFHGKKFADDILKNFPTKSNSFLQIAISISGTPYTVDQIINDKTLGRVTISDTDMGFMKSEEAAKKFKFSVYDIALTSANQWYEETYVQFSNGVLEFTDAMTNFELKYSKV